MIVAILRSISAVVAGLALAGALIVATEVLCNALHPFPPGLDPTDMEACKAHVAKFPAWVLAIGTVCWSATAGVSAWLATRLGTGRHPAHGILIGALLFAMAAMNVLMLPYQTWFEVLTPATIVLATWLGSMPGRGTPPAAAAPAMQP
jgi:hypothetical protein